MTKQSSRPQSGKSSSTESISDMKIIKQNSDGQLYITTEALAKFRRQKHSCFAALVIDRGFLGLNGGAWVITENHKGHQAKVACMTREAMETIVGRMRIPAKEREAILAKGRKAFDEAEARILAKEKPALKPAASATRCGLVDMALYDQARPKDAELFGDIQEGMASPEIILSAFRMQGFKFAVQDDRLMVSPVERLSDEQREVLQKHKESLVGLLWQESESQNQPQDAPELETPNPDIPESSGELVVVREGQATTTTLEIAAGTGVTHEAVILSTRKYQKDLEKFGSLRFEFGVMRADGRGGQKTEYAILNERQATLLISYQRNTDIVRAFKIRLVEEFYRMAEELRGKTKSKKQPEAPLTELPHTFKASFESLFAITGMSRSQAILAADRFAATIHGASFLRLAGVADGIKAECQEPLLTPTEIGKALQVSARAVNLLLEKLGLQYKHTDGDDKPQWALTAHGIDLGGTVIVVNVEGKKSTVTQIKWPRSILAYLEDQGVFTGADA